MLSVLKVCITLLKVYALECNILKHKLKSNILGVCILPEHLLALQANVSTLKIKFFKNIKNLKFKKYTTRVSVRKLENQIF